MAFVPSYGYARAVTRGTRNSARAYQRKNGWNSKIQNKTQNGHKEAYEISRRAAIEVAGAGYRYLRTRRMRKKRLGVKKLHRQPRAQQCHTTRLVQKPCRK